VTDDGAVVHRYDVARVAPDGEQRKIDPVTVEEPFSVYSGAERLAPPAPSR
jgi:hypothetical protein